MSPRRRRFSRYASEPRFLAERGDRPTPRSPASRAATSRILIGFAFTEDRELKTASHADAKVWRQIVARSTPAARRRSRSSRRGRPPWAVCTRRRQRRGHKIEIVVERRLFPRNLLVARILHHRTANAQHQFLNGNARRTDMLEQRLGERTVAPAAVGRDVVELRRIGTE